MGVSRSLPSVPRGLDAHSSPSATLANKAQCQWGQDEVMHHACIAHNSACECLCVCVIPQLLQFQTQNTCMLYTRAHVHSAFVSDFFGFMPLMINSELEK